MASGVNQDGKTPGITMPNGSAQGNSVFFSVVHQPSVFRTRLTYVETLMKSVYQAAGLDPKETGYVEAHGTGTKVGDPSTFKPIIPDMESNYTFHSRSRSITRSLWW